MGTFSCPSQGTEHLTGIKSITQRALLPTALGQDSQLFRLKGLQVAIFLNPSNHNLVYLSQNYHETLIIFQI